MLVWLFVSCEQPADDDAGVTPLTTLTWDFEDGVQGWTILNWGGALGYAGITDVEAETTTTYNSSDGSLQMNMVLDCHVSSAPARRGEATVMTDRAFDATGKVFSCRIYLPSGLAGTGNRVALNVRDSSEYHAGTTTIDPITGTHEDAWTLISSSITWDDGNFVATDARYIGVQVSLSTDTPNTYSGPVYLDDVKFE